MLQRLPFHRIRKLPHQPDPISTRHQVLERRNRGILLREPPDRTAGNAAPNPPPQTRPRALHSAQTPPSSSGSDRRDTHGARCWREPLPGTGSSRRWCCPAGYRLRPAIRPTETPWPNPPAGCAASTASEWCTRDRSQPWRSRPAAASLRPGVRPAPHQGRGG